MTLLWVGHVHGLVIAWLVVGWFWVGHGSVVTGWSWVVFS